MCLMQERNNEKLQPSQESADQASPSLLRTIARTYARTYIWLGFIKLGSDILNFAGIYLGATHHLGVAQNASMRES